MFIQWLIQVSRKQNQQVCEGIIVKVELIRVTIGLWVMFHLNTFYALFPNELPIPISSVFIITIFLLPPLHPSCFQVASVKLQFSINITNEDLISQIISIFYTQIQFQRQKMYIEPAEYLDLSDRISILMAKVNKLTSQNRSLQSAKMGLEKKVNLLQLRIQQCQKQKLKQKQCIKQHVTSKTNQILNHITSTKQNQKAVIEAQVEKTRNWSAIQILNKLQQRITQNRTITFEKQFYQKVKTLYIIKKGVTKCTSDELFNWVKDTIDCNSKDQQTDILQGISSCMAGTQKSIKKSKKSEKKIKGKSSKTIFDAILDSMVQKKVKIAQTENKELKQNQVSQYKSGQKDLLQQILQTQHENNEASTPTLPILQCI